MGLTLNHQTPGLVTVPYSIFTGRGEGSTGFDAALGHAGQGNQATLILQVKPDDLAQCLADLLGYFTLQRTDPTKLSRTEPAKHPFYPWLRCSRVTGVRGIKFTGKANPATLPGTAPGASPFPVYDHYLVSCLFTQPHYSIYDDATLDRLYPRVTASDTKVYRQEWRRWCVWSPTPSVEAVTREAGSLKWAEGGGAGAPTVGAVFNSPWPRFLPKQDITCRWMQVPAFRGVMSSDGTTPERFTNLEAALMCVNDATFRGYAAGTLLFRGWQVASWNEAPYGSDDLANRTPSLTLDLDLFFTFFDPPNGSTTRGHNLAPFSPAGAGGDGKWYKVQEQSGSRTLFDTYPFEKIFNLPG